MTLFMCDRENRKIGMEIGISGTVSSLKDFNIPDVEIFQKIQEKYNLSPDEAERCMKTDAEYCCPSKRKSFLISLMAKSRRMALPVQGSCVFRFPSAKTTMQRMKCHNIQIRTVVALFFYFTAIHPQQK